MGSHNVTLKLEGPEANNRHLELSVFLEKIGQFHKLLNSSIKSSGREGVVLNVVQLSHSSPATVGCQPTINGMPDLGVVQMINEKLNCVKNGAMEQLNDDDLSALESLAKFDPKKIAWSEIETIGTDSDDSHVYRLDDEFRAKLAQARSEEYVEISTVDGILEEINIHSKPHTFKIYDASFASATIRCLFPSELVGQVQEALGCGVFVSGTFFYRPGANTPYKIDVREIEILPPSDKLPSLSDLRGIASGATGDKMPEEFVRELRNQWDSDIR